MNKIYYVDVQMSPKMIEKFIKLTKTHENLSIGLPRNIQKCFSLLLFYLYYLFHLNYNENFS